MLKSSQFWQTFALLKRKEKLTALVVEIAQVNQRSDYCFYDLVTLFKKHSPKVGGIPLL